VNRAVAKTAARVAASRSPVPAPSAESDAPRVTSAAGATASRAMTTRERMKRAFGKQSGDAADAGPTPEPTPEPESEPVSGGGGGGGSSGGSSGGSGGGDQNGLLLPEAPDALTPAAQSRLEEVGAQIEAAGTAVTELPTAGESTAQARGAVVEPQAEQDALAQAALVTEIDTRPPPSPEIEAACERIREVIRAKRPPDEERLVEAQPREMAQEAGQEMNADVEARAGSVREGYADMQGQPQGEPGRQPVPVELPPDQVATPPLDAGTAAPDELTADDVSLDEDVAAQEQRIEDAGMTTEPAQLVEDGPIADANDSVGELASMAQSDPQQVLAEQAAAVARAQGDMQELQGAAEQLLQQARAGAVQDLGRHSGHVTGSEEAQRAQAGARMQAVFERTQQAVDGLLQPLAETALARWNAGIETLSTAFEGSLASVAQRIEARYQTEDNWDPLDEIGASLTRLGDETFGLPDWVVEEYDRAEAAFGDGATALIRDISRDVNAVIRDCQELIQQARRDIDAIVQSLPAELQAWAQGEAARLGEQLDELGARVTAAQSNLNRDLVERANTAVQEVRERVHALRVAAGGLLGRIAAAIEEFLRDPARAIMNGLLRLVGIPPASFWSLIERLQNVIAGIAEDPMGFANTLMDGVGQGFEQFFDNFSDHLGEALFQWLFSKLGEAGVTIPPDFSARSILGLILDVLGISWARIRTILARHIGEENAQLLDQAYQILSTLIERGPQGLIDMFVEQLDPQTIADMLLQVALDYIMEAIIERVAVRLLLLFNPIGAILQAIEAIYRVIAWIVNNAAQIFTLIESIVDGAAAILAGDTSGVANLVEGSLVRLMVIVIDFLAGYLGLGGIPDAIRDLILGLQSRIEAVLDRIIGFIAGRARALLAAVGLGESSAEAPQQGANDGEIGKHLRFAAGGEGHMLWIDTSGPTAVVMLASSPHPLEQHMTELRTRQGQIAATNPDIRGQTDPLFNQLEPLAQTAVQQALDAKNHQIDSPERQRADQQVEATEEAMRAPLTQLLQLLGIQIPTAVDPAVRIEFSYHSGLPANPTAADRIAGFTRADFNDQLAGQERGLNAMTVGEWARNRQSYNARAEELGEGRDPIANTLQNQFRAMQRQAILDVLQEPAGTVDTSDLAPASLRFVQDTFARFPQHSSTGFPATEAASLVDGWLATQAALHDPDQIAGGNPSGLHNLGNRRINSSIGSQWGRGRAAELDARVRAALHEIPGPLWNGIRMRVTLEAV
jgi:Novel toxin 15